MVNVRSDPTPLNGPVPTVLTGRRIFHLLKTCITLRFRAFYYDSYPVNQPSIFGSMISESRERERGREREREEERERERENERIRKLTKEFQVQGQNDRKTKLCFPILLLVTYAVRGRS